MDANVEFLSFQQEKWTQVNEYDWTDFENPAVKREFNYLNILGPAILSTEDATKVKSANNQVVTRVMRVFHFSKYTTLQEEMETTYSTAKICSFKDPNCSTPSLPLDPGALDINTNHDSN